MAKRDWRFFLKDIHQSTLKIMTYVRDVDANMLVNDEKTYDAVLRNLEVIGEAVKKIPAHVRRKYNRIPWKKIAGLRDVVIHDYFGLNDDIICDVVFTEIPTLKNQIEQIIGEIETPPTTDPENDTL